MHTGYLPTGSVRHPSLAANIAKQVADLSRDLPAVVSVGQTIGSGYLGVDYEPFVVDNPGQLPRNHRGARRRRPVIRGGSACWTSSRTILAGRGGQTVVDNHRRLYQKASKMVLSSSVKAFDINQEPENVRAKYGDSDFGRGCLLARRLVEAGVTFVEVQSRGWDTHDDVFNRVSKLASDVDPGFAALVSRSEGARAGSTARSSCGWANSAARRRSIPRGGRDHWPSGSSTWRSPAAEFEGGQVIGSSSSDGTGVQDRPVTIPDLFCSICKSLRINPRIESISPLGRPAEDRRRRQAGRRAVRLTDPCWLTRV